jgi:predicted component of type VI protein secretion system
MKILIKKGNLKISAWGLSVCLFLSGCSALTDNINSLTLDSDEAKQKIEIVDRWLDTKNRWQNWDTSHPNNQLVDWSYQENALITKFSAGRDLNTFSQRAHTLAVKIIQLNDVSGLKTLLQKADGIRAVLSETIEMIPNAIYSDSVILAPKQSSTIITTRQQDTKFVAIVSGFAELNSITSVRIIAIPVITEAQQESDKESSLFDTLTFGLFAEEKVKLPDIIRPAVVKLNVEFGESGISDFVATAL